MSEVQIGLIFPNKDIGSDRKATLGFAPYAEEAGVDFITTYDHVVNVDSARHKAESTFTSCSFIENEPIHEPMVLFGAMAATTERLRFLTGCMVAPQRQTALLAKQAAEVDVLSGGRLDLGVCGGWNRAEFEALGANFATRGPLLEEQIALMKRLWTEKSLDHILANGEQLNAVTLSPKPVQQPIPIWIGGLMRKAVERAARAGDGWVAMGPMDEKMKPRVDYFWEQVDCQGRSREDVKVVGRVNPWRHSFDYCASQYDAWVRNGATHIALGTSHDCYEDSSQYFSLLQRFVSYIGSR